ncbi:MAG TPA: PASTA domain-containing protein [Gaiellaceae bacterium]|nr:PASTA domain-containing protein [Gaiellaceae bacterium]
MLTEQDGVRPEHDEPTEVLPPPDPEEWPVAEHYRVEPHDEPPPTRDETIVVSSRSTADQGPRRRFPVEPGPGLLAAVLAAALCVGVAAWLVSQGDDDPPATRNAGATTVDAPNPASSSPPAEAGAGSRVPDVVGASFAAARAELRDAGFQVRISRRTSDRRPGEVLEQIPKADSQLASKGVVTLVAARAKRDAVAVVTTPNVVGDQVSDAAVVLREAGLVPEITLQPSDTPAGTVLSQTPEAGTNLRKGETVSMIVAEAQQTPQPERIEVPDVVDLTAADARRQLRELGFRVSVERIVSNEPAGTVVVQTPRAGRQAIEGSTVRLRVSTGPQTAAVPDVTGLDEDSARSELEAAGFVVRVIYTSTVEPLEDGVVVTQTPRSGESAAEGAVVTITVARLD